MNCRIVIANILRACWIALLLFTTLCTGAIAQPQPVVLEYAKGGLPLQGKVGVMLDGSGVLTIDDVRARYGTALFSYPETLVLDQGNGKPTWFAIGLQQTHGPGDWVLTLPSTTVQDLQFIGPFDAVGKSIGATVHTGTTRDFNTRPLNSEKFSLRVQLPGPGTYTLYVRSASQTAQVYDFRIWDLAAFFADRQDKRIFDGLCYGVLLGMLVYNLMMLLVFRDRTYAYYVLTVAFATLTVVNFNGHDAHYLFFSVPLVAERATVVFPAVWMVFGALFCHSFLNLARYAPVIGKIVIGLAGLSGFSAVVGLLGYLSLANTLNEYLALISTLVVFVGASLAWKHGFVPARWYLLGHLMLFVSVAVVVFTGWGYLRWPFVSDNGLQTGVAIEVMVFAVALSSRIRLMQSVQAELKVRTEQLTVASETDPLTGAANRAGLAQQASQVLTHPNQRTLILLDLDKFKPVNDLYGHEAGDAVLVEIARRIKALLRADDMVARVGGDEFVVLLNQANDRAVLEHISQRLLDSIAQPVAFGGQMLTVGGSLGIARYPGNGLTLPDLMQAADVAMYHIKKNGRAGYAFFDDVPNPPPAPVSG